MQFKLPKLCSCNVTVLWQELLDCVSEGDGEPFDSLEDRAVDSGQSSYQEPLRLDDSFPSTVFIAGLPKALWSNGGRSPVTEVGNDKYDKLLGVLTKLITKWGPQTW